MSENRPLCRLAKAHLQARQERLQLIDGLREKVNALAVAFDQRWGWVQRVRKGVKGLERVDGAEGSQKCRQRGEGSAKGEWGRRVPTRWAWVQVVREGRR